ncbi:imp-specific 5 -nucleotidase [Grosmannia clavigera kw1407]|uniref:IMP-specific 5'-nucleotidase 1 n=1 Tax=Grosmannia clavigera (strain kw1407 / UAMH 11150) TaxID=655863 RepID=F0XBP3_GROCL|nr:imp-specific 5 -nucleotidase [Grosmannia clavigera kw1407]EFX04893.1 imp-specific 5 -nucleotidase [Grosmannia clavigera kw1407]
MTTRYRVEYALKSHRRDQLIEWVKGLLISPFVLFSQPAGGFEDVDAVFAADSAEVRRRYAEIMRDIETMVAEHRLLQGDDLLDSRRDSWPPPRPSRLQLLVPTVGPFFTPLPLEAAFLFQDRRRRISSRRLLVTFDGDLTLYEDGQNLEPDSPLIPRILELLRRDIKVGIVTAAGYDTADRYYERLHGLLCAVRDAGPDSLTDAQKHGLVVVGGEASFVFAYSPDSPALLAAVAPTVWMPDAMKQWPADDVAELLDLAETTLRACVERLQLPATVLRKARAVGIVPLVAAGAAVFGRSSNSPGSAIVPAAAAPKTNMSREGLEEVVLTVQKRLEVSAAGRAGRVPFCAFNGGRDVFVDIGDKSWGVQICQHALRFLGGSTTTHTAARPGTTLHVGDQFLSAGANDFRARRAATTAWVANPVETCALLDELLFHLGGGAPGPTTDADAL